MLRHKPGPFTDKGVDRSVDVSMTVPRLVAPKVGEFWRGGDMTSVMNAIKSSSYVQVNAGTGAGKSTILPGLISDAGDRLVVHTIPFHIAGYFVAKYVSTLRNDVQYIDDLNADFPDKGVVITTNMYLLKRYYTDRLGKMPQFTLVMDENHESDCWTAVLRKIALSWSCVAKLVLATATADPGTDLVVKMPSARIDKVFTYKTTEKWKAVDAGYPWSAQSFTGNVCICIDRDSERIRLSNEYRDLGFSVFLLSKDSSIVEAEKTFEALTAGGNQSIILMVDYAWRSSFTIPNIKHAIDSGEVKFVNVRSDTGVPEVLYRRAYHGEQHQFINRFGRLPGNDVITWRPDGSMKRICDVEAIEADAAALLFRMAGFKPPIEYDISKLSKGKVPISLVSALQGDTPLASYRDEHVVSWVIEGAEPIKDGEHEIPSYDYQISPPVPPKPVRCQTIVEPKMHTRTLSNSDSIIELDVDSYSSIIETIASRPSSRQSVRTTGSQELNNVTVFQDKDNPVFVRPKRVAKHIQEQRSIEALKRVDVPVEAKANQVTVQSSFGRGPVSPVEDAVLEQNLKNPATSFVGSIGEDHLGKYYYYDGLGDSDYVPIVFSRGYASVVRFCESDVAVSRARVLPDRDKMFALRLLLEKYNDSTALIKGVERVMAQMSLRMADIKSFVDEGKFYSMVESMISDRTNARLDIDQCRAIMPLFMSHALYELPELSQREEKYMEMYIEKAEVVAVKRDPDKMVSYLQQMQTRPLGWRGAAGGRAKLLN